MIRLAVIFIGCWSLCFLPEGNCKAVPTGVVPSILARFDNPVKKCGIESLLLYKQNFYIDDLDDDGVVEEDDLITFEEAMSDPEYRNIRHEVFMAFDYNGDGIISVQDVRDVFELLPGMGNEGNMANYLTILSTLEDKSEGPEIDIEAFVRAENDFRIIDMNDDNIITRKELGMRFEYADRNQDGKLMGSEIRNLFPMRSTPPKNICGNWEAGCSQDNVMVLFDSAEKENESQLSNNEYLRHFGPLIEI